MEKQVDFENDLQKMFVLTVEVLEVSMIDKDDVDLRKVGFNSWGFGRVSFNIKKTCKRVCFNS